METIVVKIKDGEYRNRDATYNLINYVCRLKNMSLVGGYGVVLTGVEDVTRQFNIARQVYGFKNEKQVMHFIFSIEPTLYLKPEHAKELAYMLGKYFANERQVLFAVHNDKACLHIHMVVNTISFLNGSYKDYWAIDELKAYANMCLNKIVDRVWFGKII